MYHVPPDAFSPCILGVAVNEEAGVCIECSFSDRKLREWALAIEDAKELSPRL
jgi:hypothetical protein